MRDLTSKLFGKATYFFSVCEFQKRGLPHAHIVIKFDGASPEARRVAYSSFHLQNSFW